VREYPAVPLLGVGAIVVDGPRVLLVQRGRAPSLGKWSVPGGLVEVGEAVEAAARREVAEECDLRVTLHGLVGYVDRIVADEAGRVRYHYVILDFLAVPAGGEPRAGSDAAAVRWVRPEELAGLDVTDGLEPMIRRALRLDAARREGEADRCAWR
jgi:ADP-ribose pyrophosphatase YjhB (NUDIX family)